MILTSKQEAGLRIILERHRAGEKYTTISGYAGTGKSTLVKYAIQALDVEESKVAYATYTGKAAEVLRSKGNKGAITLHRLLYQHVPKIGGGFYRKAKPFLEATIVVVDEVSMVPKSMIDLLLSHNVYVIFLGDPFQLPQINKDDTHDLLDHPHVFLDEVMRQAQDSEIIRMTMDIRAEKPIKYNHGNEVLVIPKRELNIGHLTWADQILVATNKTRLDINNQMRELYGFSGLPQEGERLICLKNYWDDCSTSGDALVNGTVGILKHPYETFANAPRYIQMRNHKIEYLCGDFYPDGDTNGEYFEGVRMDKQMFLTGEFSLEWRESYALNKKKERIGDLVPKEFTYAYAITTHKAQGSEWPKVLVMEESFPFVKIEHARWLYTACTRASERLVLAREE